MYLNGTILNIAANDVELAERLLIENERQATSESRSAKKAARNKHSLWSSLESWSGHHQTLVTAAEGCADCGD